MSEKTARRTHRPEGLPQALPPAPGIIPASCVILSEAKNPRTLKSFPILLLLFLFLSLAAPLLAQIAEPTPVPTSESLEAWKTRIQSAVKAETSLLKELYKVESSEYAILHDLQGLDARMADLTRRKFMLEDEITAISAGLVRLEGGMKNRLRFMARTMTRGNVLRMLLRSNSIESFLRRWRAIKRISEHDKKQLMAYRARLTELAAARRTLDEDRNRIASLASEEHNKNGAAQQERDKRLYLLSQIQRDRALAERMARELEDEKQEGSAAIADLTRETPIGDASEGRFQLDFAQRKGYLTLPVKGPITGFFGPVRNEQLGTVTRNSGIDILAHEGAPVAAVADGMVRFAGEFKGYGRVVILDHGDRYHTLYGNLERIRCQKGQSVRAGDTIGTVGSTGALSGPRLHFEIRQKGQALDPMLWLAVRTGR